MIIHLLEQDFLEKYDCIIGLDEAGRGPWAGPVTVAGILLNRDQLTQISELELLNDSKKLSEKKRNLLNNQIHNGKFIHHVADIDEKVIDRVNILEATKYGILECLENLLPYVIERHDERAVLPSLGILIDGQFNNIREFILQLAAFHEINFEVMTVIDGDALCPSISAASILAKVHRDELMLTMHEKYPQYSFDKHKGYGTQLHMQKLQEHGPSEIHRMSFKPVAKIAREFTSVIS